MWITLDELLRNFNVSRRSAFRKIQKQEWIAQDCGKARNGKARKEILLTSLPLDYQLQWQRLQEDSTDRSVGEAIEVSTAAKSDTRLEQLQQTLARYSTPKFTLEQRQAVERRCVEMARLCDQVLQAMEKLRSGQGITVVTSGGKRAYHSDLGKLALRTVSTDKAYLEMYPSSAQPMAVGTLLNLARRYYEAGLAVFARKSQNLRPEVDGRCVTVPPQAIDWLKINLKSYTKASVVELGKAWLRASERLGFELPFTTSEPGKAGSCYMWLYRWVKDISGPAMTLLTEGERGLEAKYGYIIRDYSELKPRDGFVMDWRLHDVECWQPARKAGGKPLLTRLWLCPVLDLASCAVFGFELANRPSARGVTRAYLNAIADGRWAYWKNEPGLDLLCGMQITRDEQRPAFAYWDNGKDYRAYAVEGKEVVITHFDLESGLAAVLATYKVGLAAEVNITVRHAKKYNAKAKPIEPWHHYAIAPWEKTIPGYKGSKPSDRPSWYQAARRLHDDFMRRREGKLSDLRVLPPSWKEVFERNKATYGFGTPFFSEAEFRAELLKCILDYLHRPHGRLIDDVGKVSPIEYVNRYADSPQKLSDLSMAGLLMEPRILKLRRGELSVQFRGERFVYREVASELSDGSALLRVPDRTDVEFRYDPEGLGRGLVISGGAPLCWVEQPELLSWNATAEAFEAAYDQKKKAKKVAKEFLETRSRPPQWRDNVQKTTDLPVGNVLPFTRAVGAEPELSGSAQLGMGAEDDAAVITSATRYDRRHQSLPSAPPLPKNSTDDQGRDDAEQRPWVDPWETISQGDDPEEEDLIEPWE